MCTVAIEARSDTDSHQWDPLAPQRYVHDSELTLVDDAAPVPGADGDVEADPASTYRGPALEEFGPASDGSFTDPLHVVRVWFDGDTVSRVRVSTTWRQKLDGAKHGLADCLSAAVSFAQHHHCTNTSSPEVEPFPTIPDDQQRDFDSAAQIVECGDELIRHYNAVLQQMLHDEANTSDQASAVIAHDAGVTVRLGDHGLISRIDLSQTWLARAETSSINSSVVAAARAARREYLALADRGGEAQNRELHRDLEIHMASQLAWMNRGGTSL